MKSDNVRTMVRTTQSTQRCTQPFNPQAAIGIASRSHHAQPSRAAIRSRSHHAAATRSPRAALAQPATALHQPSHIFTSRRHTRRRSTPRSSKPGQRCCTASRPRGHASDACVRMGMFVSSARPAGAQPERPRGEAEVGGAVPA